VNMPQVQAALRRIGTGAPFRLAQSLNKEAEAIIGEAKLETPVKTGTLKASGVVLPPVISGQSVVVEAGFGGPSAPYGEVVHENLTARHNPPGKAKFLEDPFNRAEPGMEARIAADLSLPGVT